jgi:hypothetical protein
LSDYCGFQLWNWKVCKVPTTGCCWQKFSVCSVWAQEKNPDSTKELPLHRKPKPVSEDIASIGVHALTPVPLVSLPNLFAPKKKKG